MNLITGASGLIGRAVAARLLQENSAVRSQARSAEHVAAALYRLSVQADLEVVEMDFARAQQHDYDRLANGCSTVVHCAGLVHQPDAPAASYEALNFRATQLLATASKKAKVDNFVFLSTSAVYGNGPFKDIDEDAATKPETPYAVSKLRCEQWLKENMPAARVIVLRPSLVYGEGDRGNMLSLIRQINKGMYFHISGNTARKSIIYAGDLARAVERCITELSPGYHILNVANPVPVSVIDLSNDISRCVGRQPPVTVPDYLVKAGAIVGGALLGDKSPLTPDKVTKLMTTTTCSVERLVATTGFSPAVSLMEGIAKEVRWAQDEGILPTSAPQKAP